MISIVTIGAIHVQIQPEQERHFCEWSDRIFDRMKYKMKAQKGPFIRIMNFKCIILLLERKMFNPNCVSVQLGNG